MLGWFYVLATALLCRTLWRDAAAAGLGWVLLLLHPVLLFWFGYVESYPLLLVLQVLLVLALARAAQGRLHVAVPAIVLVAGMATHLQAVTWLPCLVPLLWSRARRTTPVTAGPVPRTGRRPLLAGAALALVAAGAAALAVRIAGASPAVYIEYVRHQAANLPRILPRLFGADHLLAVANEYVLLLGTASLLLVPSLASRDARRRRLEVWWNPLVWMLPGPLLLSFFKEAAIGPARDWDLFASIFLPALLLGVEKWHGVTAGAAPLAGRTVGYAAVVTAAWLGVNLDAGRAARRLEVLQDDRGPFSDFARSYANETLGAYWWDRDLPAARDAYRRAARADPANDRCWHNLAKAEMQLGNIEAARDAYRYLVEIGIHSYDVLHNLALCELETTQFAAAERLFDRLVVRWPDRWQDLAGRGVARLGQGRPAAALEDLSRAVELHPGDADAHHYRAEALSALGRRAEAQHAWENAVAIQPDHQQARARLDALLQESTRAEPHESR